MNRAEFAIGERVSYWNGKAFIKTYITTLNLNPITNIVNYKLFYRERNDTSKRSRVYVNTTPEYIKESIHFKEL